MDRPSLHLGKVSPKTGFCICRLVWNPDTHIELPVTAGYRCPPHRTTRQFQRPALATAQKPQSRENFKQATLYNTFCPNPAPEAVMIHKPQLAFAPRAKQTLTGHLWTKQRASLPSFLAANCCELWDGESTRSRRVPHLRRLVRSP
jgi:hypothetical protein